MCFRLLPLQDRGLSQEVWINEIHHHRPLLIPLTSFLYIHMAYYFHCCLHRTGLSVRLLYSFLCVKAAVYHQCLPHQSPIILCVLYLAGMKYLILHTGTNAGVMKHVGDALQGCNTLIGIATWGIINQRESLKFRESAEILTNKTEGMDSKYHTTKSVDKATRLVC